MFHAPCFAARYSSMRSVTRSTSDSLSVSTSGHAHFDASKTYSGMRSDSNAPFSTTLSDSVGLYLGLGLYSVPLLSAVRERESGAGAEVNLKPASSSNVVIQPSPAPHSTNIASA